MNKRGPSLTPPTHPRFFVCAGTLPDSEKAKIKEYSGPPSEGKNAAEAVGGSGEDGKEEAGGVDPNLNTKLLFGSGILAFAESVGKSAVCRQYQKRGWFNSKCKHCGDPKQGHATSIDAIRWEGVKRSKWQFANNDDMQHGKGVIVAIEWQGKDLKGTLPVGDMHMPYLETLNLGFNSELTGEPRGVSLVGVPVVLIKFLDCFSVNVLAFLYLCAVCSVLSLPILTPSFSPSLFAGDIGTLVLPESMRNLELAHCSGLTGKI